MIRDPDLIRQLLLFAQACPVTPPYPAVLPLPGYTDDQVVLAHLDQLISAGLIDGKVLRGPEMFYAANVRGLTWFGHDFAEAAANQTLWQKAVAAARQKALPMSVEVLSELLKGLAVAAAAAVSSRL